VSLHFFFSSPFGGLGKRGRFAAMRIQLKCRAGSLVGQIFNLDEIAVSLGRHPSNQVWLDPFKELGVSRYHCQILEHEGVIYIADKGSKQGTFVEGSRIHGPTPLREGSVFRLGPEGPEFEVSFPASAQQQSGSSLGLAAPAQPADGGLWICPACLRRRQGGERPCAQDGSVLAPHILLTARPGRVYSFFAQGLIQDAVLGLSSSPQPERRRLAVSFGGGVVLFSEEIAAPPPASTLPLVAVLNGGRLAESPDNAGAGASPAHRKELWCALALPQPDGADREYALQHPGLLRMCGCQALSFVPSLPPLLACLSLRPDWNEIHKSPFPRSPGSAGVPPASGIAPGKDGHSPEGLWRVEVADFLLASPAPRGSHLRLPSVSLPAELALKREPIERRLQWTLYLLDMEGDDIAESSWPYSALSQAATFGEAWAAPRPFLGCAPDGRLIRVGKDMVLDARTLRLASRPFESRAFSKLTPGCVHAATYSSPRWCLGASPGDNNKGIEN